MCLLQFFLKLLRVEWKAIHLDKSLKQKSSVPRIFLKISETNLNSRKTVKVKICERVCFALSRLPVSDFLLFNVFF